MTLVVFRAGGGLEVLLALEVLSPFRAEDSDVSHAAFAVAGGFVVFELEDGVDATGKGVLDADGVEFVVVGRLVEDDIWVWDEVSVLFVVMGEGVERNLRVNAFDGEGHERASAVDFEMV
jgi:hypothetical protein